MGVVDEALNGLGDHSVAEDTDRSGRQPKLTYKVVALLMCVPGQERMEAGRMTGPKS